MLIDTHAHIYESGFDADRKEVIRHAQEAGVERILLPAIDSESHQQLLDLCAQHPGVCIPMMGLHPTSVNDNPRWREELEVVEHHLKNPPTGGFCAIGEIGLDFYWSNDFRDEQIEAFRHQIELALTYDLPVVIHTRNAWEEMCTVINDYAGRGLRGVFHAFSDTAETYRRLREYGDFLFGIGGVVTFKKNTLAEVVREMEIGEIVLETDCPYLTPVPHRGKRNEPAYVSYIAEKIAELKGVTSEEVAATTTTNAERIFGI